jgi:uncharacterized protein YbjT (DUF2867 family)
MYVVIGATGHTGKAAAIALLQQGQKVRAVGRDAGKLASLAALGAETVAADLNDRQALGQVLAGAKAAYLMVPPDPKADDLLAAADRISSAVTEAVRVSGVSHVVLLSSIAAQRSEKTGPILAVHAFEEKLKQVPALSALFLRPTMFMENFLMMIPLIQSMGFLAGGVKGDRKMAMIATRDIGAYAAKALLALDFTGFTARELLGERDLTYEEVAQAIGAGIGRKLSYQRFPAFMVEQGMKQMGLPKKTASLMSELNDAINDGLLAPSETRSEANTTPTSIETFVDEVFVPAYRAKAAAGSP